MNVKIIVLEGPDGCGKSTLLNALTERLRSQGKSVVTGASLGDGAIGRMVRKATCVTGGKLNYTAVAYMQEMARMETLADLKEKVVDGGYIILDRWFLSTYIYDLKCVYTPTPLMLATSAMLAQLGEVTTFILTADDATLDARLDREKDLKEKDAELQKYVRKAYASMSEGGRENIVGSRVYALDSTDAPEKMVDVLLEKLGEAPVRVSSNDATNTPHVKKRRVEAILEYLNASRVELPGVLSSDLFATRYDSSSHVIKAGTEVVVWTTNGLVRAMTRSDATLTSTGNNKVYDAGMEVLYNIVLTPQVQNEVYVDFLTRQVQALHDEPFKTILLRRTRTDNDEATIDSSKLEVVAVMSPNEASGYLRIGVDLSELIPSWSGITMMYPTKEDGSVLGGYSSMSVYPLCKYDALDGMCDEKQVAYIKRLVATKLGLH